MRTMPIAISSIATKRLPSTKNENNSVSIPNLKADTFESSVKFTSKQSRLNIELGSLVSKYLKLADFEKLSFDQSVKQQERIKAVAQFVDRLVVETGVNFDFIKPVVGDINHKLHSSLFRFVRRSIDPAATLEKIYFRPDNAGNLQLEPKALIALSKNPDISMPFARLLDDIGLTRHIDALTDLAVDSPSAMKLLKTKASPAVQAKIPEIELISETKSAEVRERFLNYFR